MNNILIFLKKFLLLLISFCLMSSFMLTKSFAIPYGSITTDSRIRTLVYDPNEIYTLTVHFGYQSLLQFSEHENVESIFLAQPFAWKILHNDNYILFNTLQVGVKTNIIIKTSKHLYILDLVSKAADENLASDLVYLTRFFYVEKDKKEKFIKNESETILNSHSNFYSNLQNSENTISKSKAPLPPSDPYIDLSVGNKNINFDYSLNGKKEVTPLRIFDDGKNTFVLLKDISDIKNNNVEIFVKGESGKTKKLSPDMKNSYLQIKGIHPIISMKIRNYWVNIFNEKLKQ